MNILINDTPHDFTHMFSLPCLMSVVLCLTIIIHEEDYHVKTMVNW